MKFKFVDSKQTYDGSQLHPLFAYRNFDLLGNSIVSWVGPCAVKNEFMVDGEDLNAGSKICSDLMLHFVVEKFKTDLFSAVCLQRLLGQLALDCIREMSSASNIAIFLVRKGDDLFFENKKLNISIATQTPTSSLIHFAINVVNEGTPVPTLCLNDLGLEPRDFAEKLGESFVNEVCNIERATMKVKPVL